MIAGLTNNLKTTIFTCGHFDFPRYLTEVTKDLTFHYEQSTMHSTYTQYKQSITQRHVNSVQEGFNLFSLSIWRNLNFFTRLQQSILIIRGMRLHRFCLYQLRKKLHTSNNKIQKSKQFNILQISLIMHYQSCENISSSLILFFFYQL